MAIRGGYRPHYLRIDLDQGTITREPLPSEGILRKYLGGTGLGIYLLLRDAPPKAEATAADAPLIIMTGPLTGTPAVNSSDWVTVCFNPLVPYSAGWGMATASGGLPEARRPRGNHFHREGLEAHIPVDRR